MKRFLWQNRSLIILLVVVVITALPDEHVGPLLEYQRQAILQGQLYRLLTAHLVHTNINHMLLNLAGLILIWFLSFHRLQQRQWWAAIVISAMFVSGGLLLFNQDVQWYRGLSGVLHGILVVAILMARQLAMTIRALMLFALIGKVLLELTQSGLWLSEPLIGAPVIVAAHLYGVVGGFVSYMVLRKLKSKNLFTGRF